MKPLPPRWFFDMGEAAPPTGIVISAEPAKMAFRCGPTYFAMPTRPAVSVRVAIAAAA
ncbi:hypothetical protein [Burkholderia lata]|uniref:hypothetical protein n=1 Tax=Burkholderia lata (strain ATCC 17760 / DSM 23089 / LMG 22485 / NCIMB 9086 / R18194 / 383) TaxID=482957 RepID=UPI001582DACC|nr:hypothetical protein [Burkholderia lata]